MAPPGDKIFTQAETMAVLAERAKIADEFSIRVMRKAPGGIGAPSVIASLSGANLSHFVSPELWVPQLCGGGKYSLIAFHTGAPEPTDQQRPIAGPVQFDIGENPRDVDTTVLHKTSWRGPGVLDFPTPREARSQEQLPLYQSPPGPDQGVNATGSNQPWTRSPGGGLTRADYNTPGLQVGNWREGARALEAERRDLERAKLDAEKQRHRDEAEAAKKEHAAELRALKMEMMSMVQGAKPTGMDPMMMEFMKQAAEDRRAAETRAADDRRAQAALQAQQQIQFIQMLEKLNDRPKENPLEMFKMVNELVSSQSKKNDGIVEAQAKMIHSMSDMTTHQIQTAMDFVSAAADMQLGGSQGEKEPGWVKGLESVVKTVGAMAKGAALRRPAAVPPGYEQQMLQAQAAQQQALAQQAQAQQQPTSSKTPRPPAPPPVPPSVIIQVEMAIRAKIAPAQIAKALIENYNDPSIQQALTEAEGDLEAYVYKRLGNWVNEDPNNNPGYLKLLFAEIEKAFMSAGKIDDDEEEEEDAQVEEVAEGDEEVP